jgi:multiple sugar transport system permease protein
MTAGRLRLAGRYLILSAITVVMVGPLLWQVVTALKGQSENVYGNGSFSLPAHPTLHNFAAVMKQIPVWTYIRNSFTVAGLSIASQLLFATAGGYMLSRHGWRGAKAVFLVLVISMMFPFESIMVSLFIDIRDLNLIDSLAGVWLPGIVGAFNVLIMRAAFAAVPDEVEEAALLDGAGEWRRFTRVFLPSARGAMLVVAITTFIGAWDDFLWPFIVLRTDQHFTLTLGLARLQSTSFGFDERTVMAGSIISVIPVLVLFIATQRWFYKGVEAGAVKM